jgi:hypothetical protein
MTRITILVASILLAASCAAQDHDPNRDLAEAAKLAKVTLVDAVHKANAALSGAVVQATLQPASKQQPSSYQVRVLHDGKVFTLAVDAVSGAVGKAVEVTADADDDDEKTDMPNNQPKKVAGAATIDLAAVAIGALPTGWIPAETAGNGKLAKWSVADVAADGKRVLRLVETRNSGETFNLLLSQATFAADLDLSVRIHAESGDEDQGGGLVWRAKDADNYYVARWNPLEDNLRAYKVVGGRRSMFKSVACKADAAKWHALAIRANGKAHEVSFDGKALITFEDDTYAHGGKVGLWTKADAASRFDELQVASRQ